MKVAIQGELGSNSHMAALEMLSSQPGGVEVVPCSISVEVFERIVSGEVDGAVLPIENSLHGSVAEHYDLLLHHPVRIVRESLLRIHHNLIVNPGVSLQEVRRVLSHPVALAQCRRFLHQHRELEVVPFYDTAGSVKYIVRNGLREEAGIAPVLAARQYGGEVLVSGIEDHAENLTRFHLVVQETSPFADRKAGAQGEEKVNKMSVAFAVEHRPGTLAAALDRLRLTGVDLTKIESRPVPGRPWEYIFHVDLRFQGSSSAEAALEALGRESRMVRELGRYVAAS